MAKKSVAAIFTDYRKRLLNFIRSRVSRIEYAEDILQEVFYQFSKVNETLNPIENTAAWLYRAARGRIINQYKKKKTNRYPFLRKRLEELYSDVMFLSG